MNVTRTRIDTASVTLIEIETKGRIGSVIVTEIGKASVTRRKTVGRIASERKIAIRKNIGKTHLAKRKKHPQLAPEKIWRRKSENDGVEKRDEAHATSADGIVMTKVATGTNICFLHLRTC